jgi:hypothetical protein
MSSNRIEMDIAGEFKKISIFVYQQGFVSPLEEMACPVSLLVEVSSVAALDSVHESAEIRVWCFH